MRSKLTLAFFVFLLLSSCLALSACDSINTSTSNKTSTSVSSTRSPTAISSVVPTSNTFPTLVADPEWKVVYNHTGDAYHRISGTFTTDKSFIVVLTCQGKGNITVDINTGEKATTACSNPPQVVMDQYSSSAGQNRIINVEVEGNDVHWAVLVATSHNTAQQQQP